MAKSLLHIKTDKAQYTIPDDITVTATLDDWYPGAKIRLVMWNVDKHSSIINKYFQKPNSGTTVVWKVSGANFYNQSQSGNFDAQIEFGTLHADARFNYNDI